MIDGITLKYTLDQPFNEWTNTLSDIIFTIKVDDTTGEIITKKRLDCTNKSYTSKWQNYFLKVDIYENPNNTKQILTIRGSLHKNFHSNTNYQNFTFADLQKEIQQLCNTLHIVANKTKIDNIEVGVNIKPPFNVYSFIRHQIINFSSAKDFTKDYKDFVNAFCDLSQYKVKIYDKGAQYQLPYQLLRIEKKYHKMQPLKKFYIEYLSDLQQLEKLKPLIDELINMLDAVLIYDIDESYFKTCNQKNREFLISAKDPNYWNKLKKNNRLKYYRNIKQLKNISSINSNTIKLTLKNLIHKNWEQLFKNDTILPSGENRNETLIKTKNKECNNITNMIKGKSVSIRNCLTCGRDISKQKLSSKYCSAKEVGYEAAHKCRNMKTNPKNNFLGKLKKLEQRGLLFDIKPFFKQINF